MHRSRPSTSRSALRAFSLIELVAVIAIMAILAAAGLSLLKDGGAQARKSSSDKLMSLMDQARTTAITTRSYTVLAIAEPNDLPSGDNRCRIGLFKVASWPSGTGTPSLTGTLLNRWQSLDTGVVLLGGTPAILNSGGTSPINPLDSSKASMNYRSSGQPISVRILAFNPRGSIHYPTGQSFFFRIAEGTYRGGVASANGDNSPENIIKVGRVTARPYRIN